MKLGDILIIVALLALSVVPLVFRPEGVPGRVRILTKGRNPETLVVTRDQFGKTFHFQGKLGTSTLEISTGGKVRFVASPCPNQICVNSGWVGAPFSVVCVPNGILVDFPGQRNNVDGISR